MGVDGIIGIKLGMTQVFAEDGRLVGCTVLQAGPCVVVQRRTKDKDGYEAAQLGLVEFVKPQRVNKAMTGHFKKANVAPMKVLHEVRLPESQGETKVGDRVLVESFKAGELVEDRKSTRLNSSHSQISYAVFCLKKKKETAKLRNGRDVNLTSP